MKKYILFVSGITSVLLTTYFSLLPLNGVSQADISNLYSTSITPAGFTFSIWSIIYLTWIVLGIYWIIKNPKMKYKKILLLASAQLLTVIWLIPWHYNFVGTSLVIMLGILGLLGYLSTKKLKNTLFKNTTHLIFGWILVATLANLHIFLVYTDAYIYPIIFGVISLFIGGAINYFMAVKYKTIVPSAVFIWALIGIISNSTNIYILATCYVLLAFLLITVLMNYKVSEK